MAIVASQSGAAPPVVDVIDGVCQQPINLERTGELASWQTERSLSKITPFAVARDDTLALLYVNITDSSMNISAAVFSKFKVRWKEEFGEHNSNVEVVDDETRLTATYEGEDFISGNKRPVTFGIRFTLVGGCIFSTVITEAGHGHRSHVVALLDLIQLSS